MNMPPVRHIIVAVVILSILSFVIGILGSVWPAVLGPQAQIIAYFIAAIAFVAWLYRENRSKHSNPHEIVMHTLAKQGQKKPEVWRMPDDHHKKQD